MSGDPFSQVSALGPPPWPGPGPYALPVETWAFAVLVAGLVLLVVLFLVLRFRHPRGRRGVEGFLEAAGVDLAFLVFSVLLVLALHGAFAYGNRTAFALYRTVLDGYWLTFAIPVVTVGSSVHSRTRGGIPWLVPSVVAAAVMFAGLFSYYFYAGIPLG